MSGFVVFARKEVQEILRTWRIWVLPGILLFFAVTGPVLARFTPEIIGAVVGTQISGLTIAPPTYLDAYAQWIKNLSQIALFTLIIVYGGLVSAEVKSGTAALVLTKPVSRISFVTAKATVHGLFLAVLVVTGTAVTWAVTAVVFGGAPGSALWASASVWLVLGLLFVALMTLLSVLIPSAAGAAGAGLGGYALLSIAALWKPLGDFSPAGLGPQSAMLAAGKDADVLWPVLTALVLSVALVVLAAAAFRHRDL